MNPTETPTPAAPALTVLGQRVSAFTRFETFPRPAGINRVTMTSDEFTANCPITNQPDWYTVEISYAPRDLCLESKTLKLYLHSFRNSGEFCEALASRIAKDVRDALDALYVEVLLTQKPRGGVSIKARANAIFEKE